MTLAMDQHVSFEKEEIVDPQHWQELVTKADSEDRTVAIDHPTQVTNLIKCNGINMQDLSSELQCGSVHHPPLNIPRRTQRNSCRESPRGENARCNGFSIECPQLGFKAQTSTTQQATRIANKFVSNSTNHCGGTARFPSLNNLFEYLCL